MKKLLIILLAFIWMFYFSWVSFSECAPSAEDAFEVWQALDNCLNGSKLVGWTDSWIDGMWVSVKIKNWVNNISLYLLIFAVWSIVYGGLMMTLSAWEEEKIKKAKDIVKWWIVWFLWLISASAIISLIVKIMYSL